MENDAIQEHEDEMSLREEIIFFLKLMRSVCIYHYRYEEVFEEASWRDIVIVTGIGAVLSAVLIELVVIVSRLSYGNAGARSAAGFANVLEMLSKPAINPPTILLDIAWLLATTFLLFIAVSVIMGYCLQLWFGESQAFDRSEWLGFSLAVALVMSFQQTLVSTVNEINRFVSIGTVLNPPNMTLMLTIVIISFILLFYGYYVLYRLVGSRVTGLSYLWLRMILIFILMEAVTFVVSQGLQFVLLPIFNQIARFVIG